MSSREGKNKGRGGSSQPSNTSGKGPASKSAATSAPTSNGNSGRGGKGTNVNSSTNPTQNSNVVSGGNAPVATITQNPSTWSALVSKPTAVKTVNVDLTANSPTKQTSASTSTTINKESNVNNNTNQTSTKPTTNNTTPSIPINSGSQKVTVEDTTQKVTKTDTESKTDKSTSNLPTKSTQAPTSGPSSSSEQPKLSQLVQPSSTTNTTVSNSSQNTATSSNTAANLSVKAPVFKPTSSSSSVSSSATPFARTHSAPPSLEEQQKAFSGLTEQSSQQPIAPVYFIPQKGYYPQYYPPAPSPINFQPRMYQTAPLFVPSIQGAPISNNQPLGVSVGSNLSTQPLVSSNLTTPSATLQQTPVVVPPAPPRRNAIPIIDPKTGKEVSTAESPPKQRPKSNTLPIPVSTTTSTPASIPIANTTQTTIIAPTPNPVIPITPLTSIPTNTIPNNVGVQPLANNNSQSGNIASTSQKPITTTGPGGILPELGSMNASQAKDKGASTTSASSSIPSTASDKQSISVTPTPTPTPTTTGSNAVNTTPSIITQDSIPAIEVKSEKKKKLKDTLKKAEEGSYKAASFDAYTSSEEKKPEEKKQPTQSTTTNSQVPVVQKLNSNSNESQKQETEEDNWETKDEKELVNLKNKQNVVTTITSTVTTSDSTVSSITSVNYSFKKTINYPPGVWSPENPSGKMIYDRNFMTQFQDMEYCREKPKEMADMDEMMSLSADDNVPGTPKESREKDKQWNRQSGNYGNKGMKRTESNSNLSGSRGSSTSNTPSSTPGTQRRDNRNTSNRRTDSKKKLRSSGSISTPLPPDVAPLSTSENRWEPSRNKAITEEERVHRKVTSILNKLTEETYTKLSEKLLKVEIKTVDILRDIIKIVFDKAIWEPKFVKLYAAICNQLSQVSPAFTVDEKVHNFKRLLLNRCQEEFESAFKGSKNIKDKENEPEEEVVITPEDANKTPAEKAAQDESELRAKKQMMGNVGFIGELYKAGMLTEKIMHDCLSLLLGDIKSPSDIHIEALCRLMGSIGAEIDHHKAKKWMDQYFARMKELAKNQALPVRIRFMLENCILMRENNWLTRQEIQKEVEIKAPPVKTTTIRIATRGSLTSSNKDNSSNNSSSNSSNSRTNKYEENDWEVVGKRRDEKGRPTTSSKASEDLGLRPQTLGSGNRGAKGWSTKSSSSSSNLESKSNKDSTSKSSQTAPSSSTTTTIPEKELSVEEVETKLDDILEEFFSSNDASEATTCIKELKSPGAHPSIVTKGILIGLEKREKERIAIASLFSSLFSTSLFTSEIFVKGIMGVMDTIEDLSIDIPQAPSYIAFFVAHGLLGGYLSKTNISTFLIALGSDTSSKSTKTSVSHFIGDIIYYTSTITNESEAREIINTSDLKTSLLKSLSTPSSVDSDSFYFKFLTDKKISGILPSDSIELMFKLNHPISKIKTWVEEELGELTLSDAKVNRAITKTILTKSFVRSLSEEKQIENFKQNVDILKPFLDQNGKQQVQTLLEIQYFQSSNSSTKGMTEKIFQSLWELKLVSGKAFILWEKTSDDLLPENSKNKSEILKQAEQLLRKIKNSPQLNDDEIEGEDEDQDDNVED